METLPLPPRPNLAYYKKRAKELAAAARSGNPEAIRGWAGEWLAALAQSIGLERSPGYQDALNQAIDALVGRMKPAVAAAGGRFSLADAQYFIASAHGFQHWAAFARHLDAPFAGDTRGREFEAAADAVVSGDLASLDVLLRARPDLVRARSAREHRATLLHYVAANGVEDYRQRTPPNAVAIARALLVAGAEVDALAETYGRDHLQTTMNLLVSSAHPDIAGLHPALVNVLADFGAAVNGIQDDESPLMTALAFGYPRAAEALVARGARVDNVIAAAALGRLDLIESFVVDAGTLAPGVPLIGPVWHRVPSDPRVHLEIALTWACRFEHVPVAEWLLAQGVDPAAKDADDMTVLHHAAAHGLLDLVRSLIARGAPLEATNRWGGTVLDSTAYFAEYMPVQGVDYPAVLTALADGGADLRVLDEYPADARIVREFLDRRSTRRPDLDRTGGSS